LLRFARNDEVPGGSEAITFRTSAGHCPHEII
jgi:hypothetical protein